MKKTIAFLLVLLLASALLVGCGGGKKSSGSSSSSSSKAKTFAAPPGGDGKLDMKMPAFREVFFPIIGKSDVEEVTYETFVKAFGNVEGELVEDREGGADYKWYCISTSGEGMLIMFYKEDGKLIYDGGGSFYDD